jgi:hypothetical protein
MKKIAMIVLVVLGVALASAGEAATPKKHRTRNQNRVGPYVAAFVGMTRFTDDQSTVEQQIANIFNSSNASVQNLKVSTDNSDIGYQANFGYRFNRFIAGELGMVQYGQLASRGSADMDFGDGNGPVPVSLKYSFKVGGPVISVLGVLPFNDKFEGYVRLGFMFASTNREVSSNVNGQGSFGQTAPGDSQNPVYGVGFGWNINPAYSIRVEYQSMHDVGQKNRNGTESFDCASVGMVMRF